MNNAKIFNGALSGALATLLQNRLGVPSYANAIAAANAFATSVDNAIPVIPGDGATGGQQELIDELTRSALNGMYTTSIPSVLVNQVVAAYNAGKTSLAAEPGGGGGGGGIDQRLLVVSKNGNDTTGDGSWGKPYLTIQKCMSVVAARGDASAVIRYVVLVLPGNYDEDIVWEPWVFVQGVDHARTFRINPASITLSANWTPAGDHQAALSNCTIRSNFTIDFNSVSSNEGKFYIENSIFNQGPVFVAFSAINQVSLQNSYLLAGATFTNVNAAVIGCAFQNSGAVTITSSGALTGRVAFFNSSSDGDLIMTQGTGPEVLAELRASVFTSYQLTGPDASLYSNPNILPNVILAGGAVDPRYELTGSRAGNTVLDSLCPLLDTLGACVDHTTV